MSAVPAPNQVAAALLEAAKLCGEDALAVFDGAPKSRARVYAYAALRGRYPAAPAADLARFCGAPKPASLIVIGTTAPRDFKWWSDQTLRRVRVAISAASGKPVRVVPSPIAMRARAADPLARRPAANVVQHDDSDDEELVDRAVTIHRPKRAVAPAMCMNPLSRREPPDRNGTVVTASLAGDPPPGRSALAQGYRPGSGLAVERDR